MVVGDAVVYGAARETKKKMSKTEYQLNQMILTHSAATNMSLKMSQTFPHHGPNVLLTRRPQEIVFGDVVVYGATNVAKEEESAEERERVELSSIL